MVAFTRSKSPSPLCNCDIPAATIAVVTGESGAAIVPDCAAVTHPGARSDVNDEAEEEANHT
jgi:hypothetical protein